MEIDRRDCLQIAGALGLLGLSETNLQLSIEFLIVLLFTYSLLNVLKNKKFIGSGLIINLLLLSIITISFLLTDVNNIQMILFIRKFGIYYLFFYALFNINLGTIQKDKLLKLIVFLFLIQIPAAFIKLIVLGTQEKIVGTISIAEGSLATIMPLMAISYLIANYLEFKNVKYIVLILLFLAIGLISNKMGILFYVIILFVVLSYFYSIKSSKGFSFLNIIFIKKMIIVSVILVLIFLAFISLNPRANPEGVVGGSIDIEYLINYTDRYQNLKIKGSRVEGDGRFEAPLVALDRLGEGGLLNVLLGFGPGDIIKSSFTSFQDPLLSKYNIGYGGRLALVWILMQIGFIGLILVLFFNLLLFKKLWAVYKTNSTSEKFSVIVLTSLGFSLIYFLDFFTYSAGMIQSPGMATVYYFAIYYVLSYEQHIEKTI